MEVAEPKAAKRAGAHVRLHLAAVGCTGSWLNWPSPKTLSREVWPHG